MALFRREGKSGRRPRRVVRRLEGVRKEERRVRRRRLLSKTAIIVALVTVTMLAFVRDGVVESTVQVGDVWRQDDLVAPFQFAIRKPDAVIAAERAQIRAQTPPIFRVVPGAEDSMAVRRDSLAIRLDRALAARADYVTNVLRGRSVEASADSLRFERLRAATRLGLSGRQWNVLSRSYNERVPGLATASRTPPRDPRLDRALMNQVWTVSRQLARPGVLDVPKDSVKAAQVIVRDDETRVERPVDRTRVYGVDEAFRVAREQLAGLYPNRPDTAAIAASFLGVVLAPSLAYDAFATGREWARRERDASPSEGVVRETETIVRQGDVVTEDVHRKLVSLEQEWQDRRGPQVIWKTVAGQFVLAMSVFLIFFLYLYLLRRPIFDENRMVLLIAILFGVSIAGFAAALRLPLLNPYVVPVAIVSVILTVVFDSRVGIFGTLALTLIGGLLTNMDFTYVLATLLAGTLGVFSVRDIRNRGQFFLSAGLVFIGYTTVLFGEYLVEGSVSGRFLNNIVLTAANAVLMLLAYPLLWAVERSFGITTDVTLLELSDTNRPLLKELSIRAPGTFSHVLQVSNLAEAAASAVGANALLTRVGALYHDIGKMAKPEYFVENQRSGTNPHDQLKPRMSALIIASHVKEGLAIADEYRLPTAVTDFIPMHHGTTRIEYFYRRALDQREEDDAPVPDSDFRYPGPRPNSKETGILMLADTVEAASRSLENPTHKRLENLIGSLIEARASDHQLDDSDLTFRDLRVIRETFLNMLLGVYHVRVRYPGDDDAEPEADGEEAGLAADAEPDPAGASRA